MDAVLSQPPGTTGTPWDAVAPWLSPFPRSVQQRCRAWLAGGDPGTYLAGPDEALGEFRMDSAGCFARLAGILDRLSRTLPSPGRVVWLIENQGGRGLDDFEAAAVFGEWLSVDLLAQADGPDRRSRLVVAGTLREERVGLSFHLGNTGGPGSFHRLRSAIREVERSGLPVAVLFTTHDRARQLAGQPRHPATRWLRRRVASGSLLGLLVPRARTGRTLAATQAELAPLRKLGSGPPVRIVRFEAAGTLAPGSALSRLWRVGIECDASLLAPPPAATPAGRTTREGAYVGAGAYRPQPFDLRVPVAIQDGSGGIAIARIELGSRTAEEAWSDHRAYNRALLPPLLDFRRMESYLAHMDESAEMAQRYHDYRVYNWPPSEPPTRTTLLDGGALADVTALVRLLDQAARMAAERGPRFRLVPGDLLLQAALDEARDRLAPSVHQVRRAQIEVHGYLAEAPAEGPLRADVQRFVQLLPEELGRTLELGSGHGQLARVLSARAHSYLCLDLHPGRHRWLGHPRHPALLGLVADAQQLPFHGERFDSIVANNVLEHAYAPVACFEGLRAVLRPGGWLYALIPLDALNPRHQLSAHLWKADELNIREVCKESGLSVQRLEIIDLYALGVRGAFPSCNGLSAALHARKPLGRG